MIKKANNTHTAILANLAAELWPKHSVEELATEFTELLSRRDRAIFIKMTDDVVVGFAECSVRSDYVEGTSRSPVGYLEGIYVKKQYRNCGYAKELLYACENWAKEYGCNEFASDTELINTKSISFHLHVGFQEANRIVCFVKNL